MSFTVQEARAAFSCCSSLTRFTLAANKYSKMACPDSDGAQALATPAT